MLYFITSGHPGVGGHSLSGTGGQSWLSSSSFSRVAGHGPRLAVPLRGSAISASLRYLFSSPLPTHFVGLPVLGLSNVADRTIPMPSFTTINWLGFTSFNISTAPLG